MNLRLIPACLILMLFISCTVYREYPIEVYKPGELILPNDSKNAAIVYRNFKYPGDTLRNFWRNGNRLVKANDPDNLDSLLVSVCLNELAFNLKNQNLFDEVPVFPYNTFERHTSDKMEPLPAEIVSRLTANANAGLLIVLETYSTFFSADNRGTGIPDDQEVVTVAVWAVYQAGRNLPLERKTMMDTIYWNSLDEQGEVIPGYNPPPRHTALELASAVAGETYSQRFYPSWHTEMRMYSVPPLPDFSEAAFYFEEGKWDEAIVRWKKYAAGRNGKTAIEARYNLALAYEMKEDLNTAGQWLEEANDLAESYRSKKNLEMIAVYRNTLAERKKDILNLEQEKP